MPIPSRVAFSLFGRDIYWYGIIIASAVVIAILLAMQEAKRKKVNPDHIIDFALIAIPLAAIGARAYYVVLEWSRFSSNIVSVFYIWEGGLAIYGAIIGGVLAAVIISRWRKLSLLTLFDVAAPGLALAQALGRWGNFFNQEAYGPLVTDPGWMWFPFAVRIEATNSVHMATFFYESMWCLLIFIFIWTQRKKFKHEGDAFLFYALFYGFERMLVEGLRQDSLWLVSGVIRASQLLSALIFIAALTILLIRHVREKEKGVLIGMAALPHQGSDEVLPAAGAEEQPDDEAEIGAMNEVEIKAETKAENEVEN